MAKAPKKQARVNESEQYDPYAARNGNIDGNVVPIRNETPAEDAVVALNLGKMRRAKEEYESANGAYRNVLKHVEAKGIDLAAAKEALKIVKSGKRDEKIAELSKLFEYLYILGHPLEKKQLDLFRIEAPRTPSVDKAKEHGRYCGIMGLGMDQNPYSIDSEQGQAWIAAWHGGGEERKLVLALEPTGSELLSEDREGEEPGADHEGATGEEGEEQDEFDAADPSKNQAAE